MLWDLFCRVIDNHGDAGVCWRLAADLVSRGQRVRLWLDDVTPLAWMAPDGCSGVQVIAWTPDVAVPEPGGVVVEAFGCDPPPAFVAKMAAAARPPVWINLEYLSAEGFAERCHGLPSPQLAAPGAGLVKWFYYPGFTPATGGLVRESDLLQRQQRFDATAWLAAQGIAARPGERRVSLFCYANAALPELLDTLAAEPTLLLATAGLAARQVGAALGPQRSRGALRSIELPLLTQIDYDHLLWSCDVNFVRGEDSFVRAQWAAKPFVWQIYPQHDGAHQTKLQAFIDRFLAEAEIGLASNIATLWKAWNGSGPALRLPSLPAWSTFTWQWREQLLRQEPLGMQLIRFAGEKG
ncbi:MAG TPA: elongation factor P maturation arginine rhamnosyltransferase EarP [Albitalea sp.]|nr:elongation factor P maturation arginine rhamnosyltransferase EarP [Albitalea sp.]